MRITNIQPRLTPKYNINNYHTKPQQSIQEQPKYDKLPSTQQYLAFTGGYSLNLAETVTRLDKLAEKNSKIYPPNIREWLGMALEEGSKAKETLIAVHKKYFSSLKDCFTLEDIKAKFPDEFIDVIPATSVKSQEGSFIDRFQKGGLEYFDNDEDLSVQLIKLYWGEGFSLNDLKHYAGGVDLYHTMKRLNIPRVSQDYGHYLKFSDPQYNERLTAQMTEKRLQALDRRAQMQDGEPVYIPQKRGPLSPEHKKRISEGLKRYHQENPEAVYEMSERRKEFYRQNPECAEELSRVLKKAWGLTSSENIKKAMSRFFKTRQVPMFNPEKPTEMTSDQSKLMGLFWGENEWAKKSFSKAMKYGWKKVKEENEMVFVIRLCPDEIIRYIEKKAGVKPGTFDFDTKYNPYTQKSWIDEESSKIFTQHTDIKGISNLMADTYQMSLFQMVNHLKNLPKHKPARNEQEFEMILARLISRNKTENGYAIQTTDEARDDFIMLAQFATESRDQRLIDIVNKSLNEAFDDACQFHNFILK